MCRQVLAARRGGREALTEMAAQNARLVVGYCAKKAELKRMQEALAAERARWEVTLMSRHAVTAMLERCQDHKRSPSRADKLQPIRQWTGCCNAESTEAHAQNKERTSCCSMEHQWVARPLS